MDLDKNVGASTAYENMNILIDWGTLFGALHHLSFIFSFSKFLDIDEYLSFEQSTMDLCLELIYAKHVHSWIL